MWITDHKRYIEPKVFIVFHNRVNHNITSLGPLAYVKVNFVVNIR
jgi:hypothetical protein